MSRTELEISHLGHTPDLSILGLWETRRLPVGDPGWNSPVPGMCSEGGGWKLLSAPGEEGGSAQLYTSGSE